jgi:hypothetical protein
MWSQQPAGQLDLRTLQPSELAIDAGSFFDWGYLNDWSLLHFKALEALAMGVYGQ